MTYRVLPGRRDGERLLLDVDSAETVSVSAASLPADGGVGNRVGGDVEWGGEAPTLAGGTVETDTRFRFVRTDEPIFEAARSCFETARAAGEPMNSRITRGTDGAENGVVYTFADPAGRDLFAEFRDGSRPLEPLIERATEHVDPPVSVWVLAPADPFVAVYIVLEPDGILDRTMADTYE